MPSIFIWKSEEPNNSKKNIRCYTGSNWVLEDNDYSSKSYTYLEQIVIPGFNDSVITFRTKTMPQDWVGSDLLEVTNIPYQFIKSDNYGILEKLGCWMRFTLKNEITFDFESLQDETIRIKNWVKSEKTTVEKPRTHYKSNYKSDHNKLDSTRIQLDFQEFLIKYNLPVSTNNIILNETNTNNMNVTTDNYHKYGNHKHNKYGKNNNYPKKYYK